MPAILGLLAAAAAVDCPRRACACLLLVGIEVAETRSEVDTFAERARRVQHRTVLCRLEDMI